MELNFNIPKTYSQLDNLLNGKPQDRLLYHMIWYKYQLYLALQGVKPNNIESYITKEHLDKYLQEDISERSLRKPALVSCTLNILQQMFGDNIDKELESFTKEYLAEQAKKIFSLEVDINEIPEDERGLD